jgi:hypothetical protein
LSSRQDRAVPTDDDNIGGPDFGDGSLHDDGYPTRQLERAALLAHDLQTEWRSLEGRAIQYGNIEKAFITS